MMAIAAAAHIVNDVTQLNPVQVWAVATPTSVAEVQDVLRKVNGPVCVGGGHFSMGGQTASDGALHIDMRRMNRVVQFLPSEKRIRVQAGIRWCDIQKFVDPHGLAVKIMQTYANFTVGGSLSVNVHGRYIGLGPLILSVHAIRLVLADGAVVDASPVENTELFYGALGGYGALGVIVEAELELADNTRVQRLQQKMPLADYPAWFKQHVRDAGTAVFHNADIYAPHYTRVRAVSWVETKRPVTVPYRLQPHRRGYPLERYFIWAVSETPFGKWRREFLIDPVLYLRSPVHWRNYEAGYDAAELEPPSRKRRTYVLQEYFVPVDRLTGFVPVMAGILQRHRVNALNISIRHALGDPGSLLAWARGETFALVLYYKQRTRTNARDRVAVWTRELIDAVLAHGGTYYLPYQPHATDQQFHRAYPRARELFALKRKHDPGYRLRNVLWDKYYAPTLVEAPAPTASPATPEPIGARTNVADFRTVYGDVRSQDDFYRFLQNVYRLYPEDRFHTLIKETCAELDQDETIYRRLQDKLGTIKPFLSEAFYALPSLFKQKAEMTRQTLELLGERRDIDGYMEIGTTGRYASTLRKQVKFAGPMWFVNDVAPGFSPVDLVERGRIAKLGDWLPLADYAPIPDEVPDASLDLVTCYIGLHHIEPPKLEAFVASIWRVLRAEGLFVLRDHDVTTPAMFSFVSLAHTVFNAGLGVPWETNAQELRHFVSVQEWVDRLQRAGFTDTGKRILQAHDPSRNVLMAFVKPGQVG